MTMNYGFWTPFYSFLEANLGSKCYDSASVTRKKNELPMQNRKVFAYLCITYLTET